jgi:magnesium-transporting ATPase (P-type)
VTSLVLIFETAFSQWKVDRFVRQGQDEFENRSVSVVRDNRVQEIHIKDLLVGDLCVIKAGTNHQ